ncbi:MAG: uracil-xanthine permease [Clostridia bacterium]|nr:uracil-xanthine permease [Clostridia bacterium]
MKLIFDVNDKPKFGQLIVFAIQQLLAIMAATLVVPVIVGNDMSPAAALFGAGVGTLTYVLFTKKRSPVFLGSSFVFINSMNAAFAGAASMALGYLGLLLGALFAGLVYVIIATVVKFVGVKWIGKIMPPIVIGPTVAIIGLCLAGNAAGDMASGGLKYVAETLADGTNVMASVCSPLIAVLCGVVTLFATMVSSVYGKKSGKLIPFIYGILAGYIFSSVLTFIGNAANVDALKVIDYSALKALFANGVSLSSFVSMPDFTFLTAFAGFGELTPSYILTVAVAYAPVAFVVFAEHIADHKNLSSIIERDLLEDPGLSRTLLGDGVGSFVGALFGGCPNTTYGESVACVAITKNASVYTIIAAAIGAIIISFISPFVAFVNSIPSCVMGGVCMALYGFISISGIKMIQGIDFNENRNLFVASVIFIAGVGGLKLVFGQVTLTTVATALLLGILANVLLSGKDCKADKE